MFSGKIGAKQFADNLKLTWDVKRDGKKFTDGSITYSDLIGADAIAFQRQLKLHLEALGIPFDVKNDEYSNDQLTRDQFLAVQGAINSFFTYLTSQSTINLKD